MVPRNSMLAPPRAPALPGLENSAAQAGQLRQ
jgi:hypothetical protein